MMSSPKIASLDSLTVRAGALETVLCLGYFIITTFTSASFSALFSDDGNMLLGMTLPISIVLGTAGEFSGDLTGLELHLGER